MRSAFFLAERFKVVDPFRMLQEITPDAPNYWLAHDLLKDPKARLDLLEKYDLDAFAKEVVRQQTEEQQQAQQ